MNNRIAMKIAKEQDFFDKIIDEYIAKYMKIPGIKGVVVDDWDEQSVGRKYWFTVYLETNKQNGKRHFTKRLDYLKNMLKKVVINPDRLYDVVMPEKMREKNMFGEWYYKYDIDYAGITIFIYNKEER